MYINIYKKLIIKASVLVSVITLLDGLIILEVFQGITTVQLPYYMLQDIQYLWLYSAMIVAMINILFFIPLSMWISMWIEKGEK